MTKLLKTFWPALIYSSVAVVFLTSPFFANFGAEPAAIMAAAAFFTTVFYAGTRASGQKWFRSLRLALICLLPAAAILGVGKFAYGPCDPVRSLVFFLLFPCVSVVFGFSLKFAATAAGLSRPELKAAMLGILLVVTAVAFDIGLHPQFYTYNHVFGGFLGPIYDGYRPITLGLVVFRGLTLLWSGLLIMAALSLRRRTLSPILAASMLASAAAIATIYVFATQIGINASHKHIAQALGGHIQTEHFDVFYSPNTEASDRIRAIARQHEYQFARLQEEFGSAPGDRIRSYIYPDVATKGRLTGARSTSVSPVWLRKPQVHITYESLDRTLAHELAHVFSREHGLPVLNASIHVGLVEGLAVAVEPADGRPSPHELASSARNDSLSADRLSATAFWSGRAAVSYTTMGSFVKYLVATYGMESFLQAYPLGRFESVFGLTLEELSAGWSDYLASIEYVCVDAGPYVHRSFSVPSAFERACPFIEPRFVRLTESALALAGRRDTVKARSKVHAAWELAPESAWVSGVAARLAISDGDIEAAEHYLSRLRDPGLGTELLRGDLAVLQGRPADALNHYAAALARAPSYLRDFRASLSVRSAIADSPESVSSLYGRHLASNDSLSAWGRLALARHLFGKGKYERSSGLIGDVAPLIEQAERPVAARIAFWSAQIVGESGRWEEAIGLARRAEDDYAAMGDLNGFEETGNLIRYLRWSLQVAHPGDTSL